MIAPRCLCSISRAFSSAARRVPRQVTLIGAPLSAGQPHAGAALGPAALRAAGVAAQLHALGYTTHDAGDVCSAAPLLPHPPPSPGGLRHSAFMAQASQAIAGAVQGALAGGGMALTLGGDHSAGLGTIAGVLRARPEARVLWVDAHADINTPAGSASGNMHGMPVAFLTRLVGASALGPEWAWLATVPPLLPSRIAYIGLRDVDPEERATLKRLGITAYTMRDVDKVGIAGVMRRALKHLGVAGGSSSSPSLHPSLHLSFDIDACDPTIAPSTGTTVQGGLTFREAHYLCEAVAASGALSSMDMVEVNPAICGEAATGSGGPTAAMGVGLIASAFGKTVLGQGQGR